MKISYQKTNDNNWYVINQIVRAENDLDREFLRDCLTKYSIKQNSILKGYEVWSAWLMAISILRNIEPDKRILYRNSFFII